MGRLTRRIRIRILTVLCAVMSVPTAAGMIQDIKTYERRVERHKRLNTTDHPHEPLRRFDLDRG
jgi:hypothetical protein